MSSNDDKDVKIKKKIIEGGFMYLNNDKWVRSGKEVKDFLTLLRYTIYCIFGFYGIILREFVSLNGRYINTVIYFNDNNS